MKKLVSLILAIMMIAAVGAAWASDISTLTNGVAEQTTLGTAVGNVINFNKEIVLFNEDTTGVTAYEPSVTYSYTIAKADSTKKVAVLLESPTVTDSADDHETGVGAITAVVYNGVPDAVTFTTNTATFSNTTAVSSVKSTGTVASKTLTLTFTPAQFPHAGIYRYLITETDDTTLSRAKAGVTSGASYAATRYLDVYVLSTDGTVANNYIYGYVMFEGSTTTSITPSTTKSSGYVASETSGTYSTTDVDYYNTYNLKVTKDIDGSLADTSHEFPFRVVFTGPNDTSATIQYVVTKDGTAQTAQTTTIAKGNTAATNTIGTLADSSTLKLDDDDFVTFYGLPAGVTATVQEMNDTYDIYRVSATADSTNNGTFTYSAANVASQANATATSAISNNATTTTAATADSEVTVTNTIEVISPTGYVSRFAPYALILVAGIALLIVAKKRKPAKDDEE